MRINHESEHTRRNKTDNALVVVNPKIARILIKTYKYRVIDIRPNKADRNKTVFVFQNTDDIETVLNELINQVSNNENQAITCEKNEMAF